MLLQINDFTFSSTQFNLTVYDNQHQLVSNLQYKKKIAKLEKLKPQTNYTVKVRKRITEDVLIYLLLNLILRCNIHQNIGQNQFKLKKFFKPKGGFPILSTSVRLIQLKKDFVE